MPSKTFYNLSQEKQQKIIDASKKEFSNNLYQDVSLNQIIKNSNISRGSFYMYFTDKEDLYFYLLNEYKANFEKVIIKTLNDNNGEIFSTFGNLFTLLSNNIIKNNNSNFIKKVFLNMNYLIANELLRKKPNKTLEEYLLKHINKDYLVIKNKCDILNLLHIIIMLFMDNLTKLVNEIEDLNIIKKYYNEQLNLLKSAFYEEGGK